MRRAVTLESLTSAVRDEHDGIIEEFSDVANALNCALQLTQSGDRIVVFGSFHTVAKGLEELNKVRDHGRT